MNFINWGQGSEENMLINDRDANLILESCLFDGMGSDDVAGVLEDKETMDELRKGEIVTERTIVRLDKKARLNNAFRTAVFTVARRHKDVKFKKLLTLWRMERQIEAYLIKRYKNEAMKIAKASLKKNPVNGNGHHAAQVRKAISKAKDQLNASAKKTA